MVEEVVQCSVHCVCTFSKSRIFFRGEKRRKIAFIRIQMFCLFCGFFFVFRFGFFLIGFEKRKKIVFRYIFNLLIIVSVKKSFGFEF